jgi:hypothetical protein
MEDVRRPSGYILVDGQEVAHTLQCAHCQKHWVVVAGSCKTRGWCIECKKPTCGSEMCNTYHAPREAVLDFQDGNEKVVRKLAQQFPGIQMLSR